MNHTKIFAAPLAMASILLTATVATAAGSHSGTHGHGNAPDIGQPGTDHIDRTIKVEMGEMYFSPGQIEVRAGETVRFEIANTGNLVHEFSIGTTGMHMGHTEEMMAMMDQGLLDGDRINHHMMSTGEMQHDDPNSILLEPGETAELVWTFDGDAEIEVSCNVPGHREGGMLGDIRFVDVQS